MSELLISPMPADTNTAQKIRRLGPSPWPWMIVACALVAASGFVRINQERQFADAARSVETAPFSMRDLPKELGEHWIMDGDEQILDAKTQQIAGCSDYMCRTYIDDRTGVRLTVLVAFGPADRVFYHSPVECFPANGFQHRGGPWRRGVAIANTDRESESGRKVPFAALAYGKSGGGLESLTEVYYSFWHDQRWSPYAEKTSKLFRHRPAMFKNPDRTTHRPRRNRCRQQSNRRLHRIARSGN